MDTKKQMRRFYQKKFNTIKHYIIENPSQGWVKTIREIFGMTTTQFAKKIGVKQPRIINIEKNEKNTKISTMENIAEALNCDFVYAFIPRENIDNILYAQAKKKAEKIINKVNQNMRLENQLADNNELLDDLIKDLLNNNIARLWDDED